MQKYGFDWINGREVPPLVITSDFDLLGEHQGTVHVENGTLTISGELHGTLDVQCSANVIIWGKQHGTVSLENGASVTIYGELYGTTSLSNNSTIIIEEGGKLSGTLSNHGQMIIRGVFGGAQSGNGKFIIEGNGYIKQPVINNGISHYEW